MSDWRNEANTAGINHVHARKHETAAIEFRRALAVDPCSYELWSNLSATLWTMRRYDEALDAVKRSLHLKPDYALALSNLGMIYEGIGEHVLAERAFDEALETDPGCIKARYNRTLFRLGHRDWGRGFDDYDTRFVNHGSYYPNMPMPFWRGESLAGKGIHVEVEQGVGDTIFFARWLPWLAEQADWVSVCAAPRVVQLLWGYKDIIEFFPQYVPFPNADYSIYLGSIPRYYGVHDGHIPPDPGYIRLHAEASGEMVKLDPPTADPAIKVGICWTGNPAMDRNEERSIPLPLFCELARDPRVWLYSLHAGPMEADIRRIGAEGIVSDLGPQLRDKGFLGTATAILQCDLVITCCTAVAHLAGAMGVPAWILLCKDPYWIWGYDNSDTSPWYPSLRLFRQPKSGDWDSVFAKVRVELAELLS